MMLGGFPALFAPASLKRQLARRQPPSQVGFPALFAPASLKLRRPNQPANGRRMFSGAFCAGLIEASGLMNLLLSASPCFPALFAPASLKLLVRAVGSGVGGMFSGAFCAGLIEAASCTTVPIPTPPVFRRFLRRPH